MTDAGIDFGNTSWLFYVTMAYVATGVVFIGYGWVCYKKRIEALDALESEGFIDS
jgi:hypothetical protein